MHSKIKIINYGCSSNIADGETLAGCLKQAGYTLTATEAEADLIIFNSCAVKGPTENRIIDDIKHAPVGKKVVVAGCLPKISFERLNREVHFDAAVGPAAGKHIVDVVKQVLLGENVVALTTQEEIPPYLKCLQIQWSVLFLSTLVAWEAVLTAVLCRHVGI